MLRFVFARKRPAEKMNARDFFIKHSPTKFTVSYGPQELAPNGVLINQSLPPKLLFTPPPKKKVTFVFNPQNFLSKRFELGKCFNIEYKIECTRSPKSYNYDKGLN